MMLQALAVAVIILQSSFMLIKINLTSKHASNAANANEYPWFIGMFQSIHALLIMLPFIWAIGALTHPILVIPWIDYQWLRWVFVGLYLLIIYLMVWQMRSLSVNISASHVDRFLVTSGPYRYVRHPLYLVFILMMIDLLVITANWIFAIGFLLAIVASKVRADYEEQLLLEEYGELYYRYQKDTGQLFPKLRVLRNQ